MISERLKNLGEYAGAGLFEEPERSLFYRKALGIRRFYEHCDLAPYEGKLLYPSGVIPNQMHIYPYYTFGIAVRALEESGIDQEIMDAYHKAFTNYQSSVPQEHRVSGNMYTHSFPHYERILKEGLLSYTERIQNIQDTDMREGLLHLVEGISTYLSRCVSYLEEVQADPNLIAALKKVPLHPAETIFEAVVAWNFILYLDNCDNLGCIASGLAPYHKGEDIVPLLQNLYDNLDANNGYSMALGTEYNALTLQCLEASKGKRRPMIELFVDETTPDEIWEKAFEVIRTQNGQPAFYNPALIEGLTKRFPHITKEDAKKFCGGGCTESMFAGLSNVGSLDAGINLLLILEAVLHEHLADSQTFEEFYDLYLRKIAEVVNRVTDSISQSQKDRARYQPLPMRTLLVDDCIDNGVEFNTGGARYCYSIINFAGMINVIDGLLVIRDLIFTQKNYSPQELLRHLTENDKSFLATVQEHPVRFGIDHPDANALAQRFSHDVYTMLDGKTPYLGSGFIPSSIQFMSQVEAGRNIGATPDGREAGAPLCDSLGAIFCKDTQGPTALLNSVTSLALEKAIGTPVLSFNLQSDFDNNILKALILGYMEQGGLQIQLTCASPELLQDAYEHPERHKNLIVRVGGYSEYFCNLSDDLKKMIIARSIQKLH